MAFFRSPFDPVGFSRNEAADELEAPVAELPVVEVRSLHSAFSPECDGIFLQIRC